MPDSVLDDISHRRYNPLKGTWILVSPHRTKRPWQGQQEDAGQTTLPDYDASCYLCPGNRRAGGDVNPDYQETYVFVNDYSAVKEDQATYSSPEDGNPLSNTLLRAEPVTGRCYVVTFSPSHNLTLADLSPSEILPIIQRWTQIYKSHLPSDSPLLASVTGGELQASDLPMAKAREQYRYMQIFENKGAAMGCSNPHPHGQIWTLTGMPEESATELKYMQEYLSQHSRHMLADYASLEIESQERVIFSNEFFLVVCPWWAIWPYETMIVSRTHFRALPDLAAKHQACLAEAIADITRRYDNLFQTHFPYSMGLHQAPLIGSEQEMEASYFHIHFYPPLLRSATVRKFLVGYEMLAEPQRDITPEQAASKLRECGGPLYRKTPKS